MPAKIDARREAVVLRHLEDGASIREAGRRAGVSFSVARRVWQERSDAEKSTPIGVAVDTEQPCRVEESGDGRTIEIHSDKPIVTLEDAVAHARVDLSVWRVKRWVAGGWQVGMKLVEQTAEGRKDVPVTRQLWKVTLWLERIVPRVIHDAADGIVSRMAKHAPVYKANRPHAPGPPHLMVVDLVDVHFGKLAWAAETGQNYDLKIADRLYREAVRTLLSRSSGYSVEEFLVPLGSDFLHIDNLGGTTTAGTPQDVDGRLAKILETAEAAVIYAVEEMAAHGRVVVRWVPGNHDTLISYCLARMIAAWFRRHERVTVDCAPTHRKYHRYHKTLIGLTHGHEEKHVTLPGLMATEASEDFAATTCREWHVGHLHKSKELHYLPLDTHNGIPVRTLRSLSGVDAWHYRKGFVGATRSAEAYLYDADGLVGHFFADVKGSD